MPRTDPPVAPPFSQGQRGETGWAAWVHAQVEAQWAEKVAVAALTDPASAARVALNATYAPIAVQRPSSLNSAVALAKVYDRSSQIYNLTPDNTRYTRAALARQRNNETPMRLSVIGNSIAFGSPTAPCYLNSFVSRLRTILDGKWGAAGTGIVYPIDTTRTDDTRIVESGAWASLVMHGAFNVGCRYSSTAGNTWTFGAVTCDSFTFYLVAGSGGSFTLSIDGGAAQTFTSSTSGEVVWLVTKAAGALGSHTVALSVISGTVYIIGVEGTIGSTSGIRVSRCARGGTYLGTPAAVGNFDTINASTVDSMKTGIDMSQPDLTVLFFETNEYLQQVSLSSFTSGLTTVINRAVAQHSDVVLCTTAPSTDVSKTIPLSSYTATLYAAAESFNVPLIDITDRWKDYNTSSAAPLSLYADGNHPSPRGHWDIAGCVANVLNRLAP